MMIELIQPLDDTPSIFTDALQDTGEGLHHVAWRCDDFDVTLQQFHAQGCPTAMSVTLPGGSRVAYVDAREKLGSYVEFGDIPDGVFSFFDEMERTCREWDGRDPIRPYLKLTL